MVKLYFERIVQRTLLDVGRRSRSSILVPLSLMRLQWGRSLRDLIINKYKSLSWWDESRFLIHYIYGPIWLQFFKEMKGFGRNGLPGGQLLHSCASDLKRILRGVYYSLWDVSKTLIWHKTEDDNSRISEHN